MKLITRAFQLLLLLRGLKWCLRRHFCWLRSLAIFWKRCALFSMRWLHDRFFSAREARGQLYRYFDIYDIPHIRYILLHASITSFAFKKACALARFSVKLRLSAFYLINWCLPIWISRRGTLAIKIPLLWRQEGIIFSLVYIAELSPSFDDVTYSSTVAIISLPDYRWRYSYFPSKF